jgi:DNA-binding MarR family transcriptional regulator
VSPPAGDAARATRVWALMRALVLDRYDRRAEVCAALGMSFFRIKVLRMVAEEPATMGVLAERLNSDPPYITLLVDDLQQRGLVVRTEHPDDRRRKIVSATPEGRRAAALADSLLGAPPPAIIELDDRELADLERVLGGLLDHGPG